MPDTKLLVRNMVCQRCIESVKSLLQRLKLSYKEVNLGVVVLAGKPGAAQREALATGLEQSGFSLLETRVQQLVGAVRQAVLDYVAGGIENSHIKLSAFIRNRVPNDYSYLSDLFSSVEGRSIEQFHISQRVERVKELLVYDELSLTQIAYETGYSSVHHLSAQFKKITGITPTNFRKLATHNRKPLDEV